MTSVTVDPAGSETLNSPAGHPYQRVVGTVSGVVSAAEDVQGLTGPASYTAEFELFYPADAPSSLLLMEIENRGSPVSPSILDDLPLGPANSSPAVTDWPAYSTQPYGGVGFLLDGRRSWARVQWQTGLATGVPADAQGIGLVIVRDFGRLLAGQQAGLLNEIGVSPYRDRVLFGASQSAWFINTFIAEGFNQDPGRPGRGVYDVAMTINGAGNWLAINQLAGLAPQIPYVLPDGVPLAPEELLHRRASDPFLIDVAAYTDFYRLRAGATDATEISERRMRRYDWPAAHAPRALLPPALVDAIVFGLSGCNNHTPIPLNPIDWRPYARALLVAIEDELVARHAEQQKFRGRELPASTMFDLGPVPTDVLTYNGLQAFNPLPGMDVPVPVTDDDGWPIGGVRYPDADLPVGRLLPAAIPHVGTESIADTCGNFGGYEPLSAVELAERYISAEDYLDAYAASLDALIADGILRSDRPRSDAGRGGHALRRCDIGATPRQSRVRGSSAWCPTCRSEAARSRVRPPFECARRERLQPLPRRDRQMKSSVSEPPDPLGDHRPDRA